MKLLISSTIMKSVHFLLVLLPSLASSFRPIGLSSMSFSSWIIILWGWYKLSRHSQDHLVHIDMLVDTKYKNETTRNLKCTFNIFPCPSWCCANSLYLSDYGLCNTSQLRSAATSRRMGTTTSTRCKGKLQITSLVEIWQATLQAAVWGSRPSLTYPTSKF